MIKLFPIILGSIKVSILCHQSFIACCVKPNHDPNFLVAFIDCNDLSMTELLVPHQLVNGEVIQIQLSSHLCFINHISIHKYI